MYDQFIATVEVWCRNCMLYTLVCRNGILFRQCQKCQCERL